MYFIASTLGQRIQPPRSPHPTPNRHDPNQLAIALPHVPTNTSLKSHGLFKTNYICDAILSSFALQLFILYTPGIQQIFGVHAPEPFDWVIAALFAGIVFAALEIGKYIASKRRKPNST
ncbi:MAG: cation transporting ATPase C-terminal domain-containing protein [Candidatus Bathyarchaeia archaeon]